MNKKKGFTLVEVLVSITIFLSVFAVILSTYYLAQKRVYRQEETQYIENLCLDIDKIYDNEGYEGLVNYYKFKALSDSDITSNYKVETIPEDYFINDDSSNQETTPISDDSSSDSSIEKVNQVKNVVRYLIVENKGDNSTYLNTINKTLNSTATSTRDNDEAKVNENAKKEDRYNEDNTKKYEVSIQNYILKYTENIHQELITSITYQKKDYKLESLSIYLDSNYKYTINKDAYKYRLDYSFNSSLYEVITNYDVINYTNNIKETYDEYSTLISYTKKAPTESGDDETDSSETDEYTQDTTKEDYTPTKEEIAHKVEIVSSSDKTTVKKAYKEYIMDIKTTEFTITITNIKDNYVLIKDLEYGSSKYDDAYINSIKEEIDVAQ